MERYQVTADDRARIAPQADMLKVSGDQIFATLQGEGVTAGSKAIFLRLHFCNLACGKESGWQCDTGYTWDKDRPEFWQEPQNWSYLDTANNVKKLWADEFGQTTPDDEKRIVITGGEPLLQQKKIVELLEYMPNWKVEIETNGTIKPSDKLNRCQINCSPKLENSGNSKGRRYKPEVLKAINEMPNSWFKFVVVTSHDLDEVSQIANDCGLSPEKIMIMPEGHTKEATDEHQASFEHEALKRGWKIAKRNQLEWFGSKRRT
jgi:organic radical activating enzyme